MKKNEIKVGETYMATVSGQWVEVKVDDISMPKRYTRTGRATTVYHITNLKTGRKLTFRSAMKFSPLGSRHEMPRMKKVEPAHTCECGEEYLFLKPAVCKCGRPIPVKESDVPFDAGKFAEFRETMDAVIDVQQVGETPAQEFARMFPNQQTRIDAEESAAEIG